MSNSIAPGSSADVNVRVTALTTNPNVPVTYKTIILKKNLVNGVNTLTQEMMSTANTKYVIKYDYVLGENITIPSNCILEFDGGSISGAYTLTGANTGIEAGLTKIFNTNVILAGTWNVAEAYTEWFGAIGDGITDDTQSIQKTLSLFYKIKLSKKTYLTDELNITHRCIIDGNHAILKANAQCESVLSIIANNTSIKNIEIQGNNNANFGISIFTGQFSIFEDIKVTNCKLYGIAVLNASTPPTPYSGTLNADFIHWKNINIESCGNTVVKSGLTITSNTVTFSKSVLNTNYADTFREVEALLYIMSDDELNGITNVISSNDDITITLFRNISDASTVELRIGGSIILCGSDANCMTFENLSVAGGNSGIRQETSYGSTFIQSHIGGCYIDINIGYFQNNYCPVGNMFINTYHENYGAPFYKLLAIGGYSANIIFVGGYYFTKSNIQTYSVNPAGYGLHGIGVYSQDTFE